MNWAILDPNGIVLNIITYDGSSPFAPPAGCTIAQVNNWVQIGQNQNTSQPIPPTPSPAAPIVPDLATQLAAALIAANVIPASAIDSSTLATVNATLTAAGQATIVLSSVQNKIGS